MPRRRPLSTGTGVDNPDNLDLLRRQHTSNVQNVGSLRRSADQIGASDQIIDPHRFVRKFRGREKEGFKNERQQDRFVGRLNDRLAGNTFSDNAGENFLANHDFAGQNFDTQADFTAARLERMGEGVASAPGRATGNDPEPRRVDGGPFTPSGTPGVARRVDGGPDTLGPGRAALPRGADRAETRALRRDFRGTQRREARVDGGGGDFQQAIPSTGLQAPSGPGRVFSEGDINLHTPPGSNIRNRDVAGKAPGGGVSRVSSPATSSPSQSTGNAGLDAINAEARERFPLGEFDLLDPQTNQEANDLFARAIKAAGGDYHALREEIGPERLGDRMREWFGKGDTLNQSGVIQIGNGLTMNSLRDLGDFQGGGGDRRPPRAPKGPGDDRPGRRGGRDPRTRRRKPDGTLPPPSQDFAVPPDVPDPFQQEVAPGEPPENVTGGTDPFSEQITNTLGVLMEQGLNPLSNNELAVDEAILGMLSEGGQPDPDRLAARLEGIREATETLREAELDTQRADLADRGTLNSGFRTAGERRLGERLHRDALSMLRDASLDEGDRANQRFLTGVGVGASQAAGRRGQLLEAVGESGDRQRMLQDTAFGIFDRNAAINEAAASFGLDLARLKEEIAQGRLAQSEGPLRMMADWLALIARGHI